MKAVITTRSISQPSVSVSLWGAGFLAAVLLAIISLPAQAQTTSADLQTPVGSSDRDANTNNGSLDSLNGMFDLIHRVQQGSIRDPYQFSRDQQQSINSEASTFRQRQAELLKQQGQTGAVPGQITAPDNQEIR
ncbi:MAG: hypothetical protein HY785_25755 [Oscillatoriophycideae cyanobacterium NC_groundwater_1537_Pr4_S-0.65um_50_18]|nr:hypothetical protein [Oscillatoriophycideae cyanobacterium NC_groundwater_1537_Pr4_S-0.65um_50_18]